VLVGFIGGRGPADDLRQQNNNLLNNRLELQSELENTNKTLDLARKSLFRLEGEAKEREEELRARTEERDTLIAEKDGLEKEVERLQDEVEALQQPPPEEEP
jgi:septal ring factor EnvC (AmiA/AmiB activator)